LKEQLQSAAGFVVFLMMCLGAQLTSSFLTMPAISMGWYADLEKPFFNPPGWLFGPIWTVLYFIMAIAAWMVWRHESENPLVKPALLFFFAQLIFNVLWPALFFGMRRPGLALMEIILLWLLILATAFIFYRITKWAALLLVPYLAWVLYAAVLSGAIWWLNRGFAGPGGGMVI
jgi:tryptophan-rich sensory protein